MRTRIALVTAMMAAGMTCSTLVLAAAVPSATASVDPPAPRTAVDVSSVGPSEGRAGGTVFVPSGWPFDVHTTTSVAPTATPATPPAAPAAPAAAPAAPPTPPGPVDTVTPAQRDEWERVALCEEGGDWSADGGRFSGGLGITRANWIAYGGEQYAPEGAMATEDEQIMVAERIQSYPPDQDGCSGW